MPGEGNKKQEKKKTKSEIYAEYLRLVDEQFVKASGLVDVNTGNEAYDKKVKENVLNALATAMAYARLADRYGYIDQEDKNSVEFAEDLAEERIKMRRNKMFDEVIGSMDNNELHEFLHVKSENGKEPVPITKYEQFVKKYQQRETAMTPEFAKRRRLGDLVTTLEQSTQKSIFGKIKSVFTGNSQQYKDALAAMKNLAAGKLKEEKDIQNAKDTIEAYVTARGAKVRDHQYGRDRFDAFMRGLGEVMTPEEFQRTCSGLNAMRKEAGEPGFDPLDYLPTQEKKDAFLKTEKAVKEKIAKTDRNINKQVRGLKNNASEEVDHAKTDRTRILVDADKIAKGIRDKRNLTVTQRNQQYLDQLRKFTPEKLSSEEYKDSLEVVKSTFNNRFLEHPSLRAPAEQIIKERGLQDFFTVPETVTSLLGDEALETLKRQTKELQQLDREKNPGLTIEDVQVDKAEYKLNAVQPTTDGKQAGGASPTL